MCKPLCSKFGLHVTQFIYNRVIWTLQNMTQHYKLSPSFAELTAVRNYIFDCSRFIQLESTISHANSSKILHSKTLLTVVVFEITHCWCVILKKIFFFDASHFYVYEDCDEIGCLASQMHCC